jgi:hypothetical protein
MGPSTDGVNMLSIDSSEEFTYDAYCKVLTYILYLYSQGQSSYMYTMFAYGQPMIKASNILDNSNQRLISQTTQIRSGNDLVNSNRTWYSYEGLELDIQGENDLPTSHSLKQNYPNPFNPTTTISFDLTEESEVEITIYNTAGELIKKLVNTNMTPGSKTITWDGKDKDGNVVSGGVYLYNLQTGNYNQTKRMVLLK